MARRAARSAALANEIAVEAQEKDLDHNALGNRRLARWIELSNDLAWHSEGVVACAKSLAGPALIQARCPGSLVESMISRGIVAMYGQRALHASI